MIGLTRIYKVNGHYVIAKSPEDAIRIYKEGEDDRIKDILEVRLLADGKYPDFAYIDKWEPSEEQMEALEKARELIHNPATIGEANKILYNLEHLMNELKEMMQ